MPDLGFLTRWSGISRWLLSFFGGCGIAILLLLHHTDRPFVPGSKNISDGWYRVGLFAPGNDHGKIDGATVRAVAEVQDIVGTVPWSTQQLNYSDASGKSGTGAFAFVSSDYLRLLGIRSPGGHDEVPDGPEILLTSEGAAALAVTAGEMPIQIKIGTRHFLARTILPESYIGPLSYEPVLGLIHLNWLNVLTFPARPNGEADQIPAYDLLVYAPSVSDSRDLTASILSSGIRSESQFLAEATRTSWVAFNGPHRSPEEADAEKLFRSVLLVVSLTLFFTASLVYVVAESLSNATIVRTIAIRSALGEVASHRTRWLFFMAISKAPSVAGATFVVAAASYLAYISSIETEAAQYSSAATFFHALSASLILTSIPLLMSFGCNYILSRTVSISDGLGGHQSRIIYDALAGKLLFASAVLLSAISSASLVFILAINGFNSRPLGFDADGLSQASISRPDSSPESREAGLAETIQIESIQQKTGIDLGAASCAPLHSEGAITNIDTPTAGVAVALLCHASPGAIAALDLDYLSGGIFSAQDELAAVVTSDFLIDVNGGGHVGSTILQEALGRAHRVVGIVRPVNLDASYGPSPPVVFLNGSEFGLRGTLLIRGGKAGLAAEISESFGNGTRLGEVESVRGLIAVANASFLSQRNFALIASVACAALCSLALIACCLLVLVAWRKEIGIRLALGAPDRAVKLWTLGNLSRHVAYGLATGLILAPIIGFLLNRILPVQAYSILISMSVSAVFCLSIVAVSINVAVRHFTKSASISNLMRH